MMKWTEPSSYWNYSVAHMVGGGLLVLFSSWAFARLSGYRYFFVLALPLGAGLARELYQFIAEDNQFPMALQNVAEWTFGGLVFSIMIKLAIGF